MPIRRAQITEKEVPSEITRDIEASAIVNAAITDHITGDPHLQYLNQSRGDTRYQSLLPVTIVQQQVGPPGQISIIANSWFSLGTLNNLNSGNSESLFLAALYIQYVALGTTNTYWQYSGSFHVSPVWWKAGGAQLVKYVDMEAHDGNDFILIFRLAAGGQGSRMVELFFPFAFSARLIRATFIRLR